MKEFKVGENRNVLPKVCGGLCALLVCVVAMSVFVITAAAAEEPQVQEEQSKYPISDQLLSKREQDRIKQEELDAKLRAEEEAARLEEERRQAEAEELAALEELIDEGELTGGEWSDEEGGYVFYDNYGGMVVYDYNPLYNENGPSRTMPGWYDGYLETYYSSNTLHHYRTDEWTADEDGFYRDSEGRYVVGVAAEDINPETGEGYQIGDVVQTGKGEAVVMDYGSGAKVHDFYTNW